MKSEASQCVLKSKITGLRKPIEKKKRSCSPAIIYYMYIIEIQMLNLKTVGSLCRFIELGLGFNQISNSNNTWPESQVSDVFDFMKWSVKWVLQSRAENNWPSSWKLTGRGQKPNESYDTYRCDKLSMTRISSMKAHTNPKVNSSNLDADEWIDHWTLICVY